MNDLDIKNFQNDLEKAGTNIAELISNLDIPMEYKEILVRKSVELVNNPQEFVQFSQKLFEEYLLQQVIENDPEYKEELKKINQKTEEEIKNILNS